MRFLCLHGAGTSSPVRFPFQKSAPFANEAKVFEAQTAALRYELGDNHTYDFVQGTLARPMAQELASMSQAGGHYYAYFDRSSIESYIRAVEQLDEYVSAEGPYDGVLAFSQGAGLAAMHLVHKSLQEPKKDPPFKVAILIACIAVYDPVAWLEQRLVRPLDPSVDGEPIGIPTAHIWGMQDRNRSECKVLSDLSNPTLRAVFVHQGGHEVPSMGTPGAVSGAVQAVRRAITMAMQSH